MRPCRMRPMLLINRPVAIDSGPLYSLGWVGWSRGSHKPNSVLRRMRVAAAIIYLRRRLPGASSGQPGGIQASHLWVAGRTGLPLLLSGLAPDGVYLGQPVTRLPVSSYLTISTLPAGDLLT
jgi:hypothetical protein